MNIKFVILLYALLIILLRNAVGKLNLWGRRYRGLMVLRPSFLLAYTCDILGILAISGFVAISAITLYREPAMLENATTLFLYGLMGVMFTLSALGSFMASYWQRRKCIFFDEAVLYVCRPFRKVQDFRWAEIREITIREVNPDNRTLYIYGPDREALGAYGMQMLEGCDAFMDIVKKRNIYLQTERARGYETRK